jgi:hypothetical protein
MLAGLYTITFSRPAGNASETLTSFGIFHACCEGIPELKVPGAIDAIHRKKVAAALKTTYIPLRTGDFAYLALAMDLFSRRVLGWTLPRR